MTNKEAIDIIKTAVAEVEWNYPMEYASAFDKAIKALERQPIGIDVHCKIGDTIYVIPSKVNYCINKRYECLKANNRVYEQKVEEIHIYQSGYTVSSCEGLQQHSGELFGETWFLSKEEAIKALKEYEK